MRENAANCSATARSTISEVLIFFVRVSLMLFTKKKKCYVADKNVIAAMTGWSEMVQLSEMCPD